MERKVISTSKAPAAIGPYSQGMVVGNLLYTSGQLPIDQSGKLVNDDIKLATATCLDNIKAILEEAGTSMDKVVKTMVFIRDMKDFAAMNEVYGTYFTQNPPARSCVQPAMLPKDAMLEIEVIAVID